MRRLAVVALLAVAVTFALYPSTPEPLDERAWLERVEQETHQAAQKAAQDAADRAARQVLERTR